ncbi:Ycf66 family protein [Myxosarcina sp. GI1]|uniref:Ycf66 family protein n=1 Tax=Myxosarcina sp. GI1 TaxID=1541065 RepID=UPI0009DF778A
MVNFGLNSASILGIFLAVAGASLYFMRSVRPELSRDHDIFFAAVGLLCGFILLFQGWRLDPILQFGQFLLTGTTVFFAVESIRLRGVATEQARRNTPTVDRDRPVSRSRVYTEAELDKFDVDEDRGTPNYNSPRLRGYEEPYSRSARRPSDTRSSEPAYDNYSYSDSGVEPSSRSRSSRSRNSRPDATEPPNTRSRRRQTAQPRNRDVYAEQPNPARDVASYSSPRPRTRPASNGGYTDPPSTVRRRANPANLGRNYEPEADRGYDADLSRDYEPGSDRYDADLGRDYEPDLDRSYEPDLGRDYEPDLDRGYDANLGSDYEDNYDDEEIATDYVDYQPLEDSQADYSNDSSDRPIISTDERQPRRDERSERNNLNFDY